MGTINVASLLEPILGDAPCGEDLEYDPPFSEMEQAVAGKPEQQFGDTVIPGEAPNWREVRRIAVDLLSRTKDLRVALYLTQALVHTDGFFGLRDGLVLLRGLIERYWETLHPALEPDDDNPATYRLNVLSSLNDYRTFIAPVSSAPLVRTPGCESVSLRDLGFGAGTASPKEQWWKSLNTGAGKTASTAVPLDELQTTANTIEDALAQLIGIEQALMTRVGVPNMPDLSAIRNLLDEGLKTVRSRLRAQENRFYDTAPGDRATEEVSLDAAEPTSRASSPSRRDTIPEDWDMSPDTGEHTIVKPSPAEPPTSPFPASVPKADLREQGGLLDEAISATRTSGDSSRIEALLEYVFSGNSSGSQSVRKDVQAALMDLTLGRILFNPPREMKAGVKERVEVRISRTLTTWLEVMTRGLRGRGEVETAEIRVGSFMKVRLTGSAFEINALSHEAQLVPDEGFAHWEWDVLPVRGGLQSLLLSVTVRIKVRNAGEEPMDLPVFERNILVAVSLLFYAKRFLERNWKWVASAILLPLIVWAWKVFWP